MGSILPVGDGNSRPIVPPSVQAGGQGQVPANSDVTNQTASTVKSASSSSSVAVSQIQTSTTQLLESFGGSSANSQAMQLLIALMILIALLESTQNSDGNGGGSGGESGLSRLGSGSSDKSQYIGIFSSSSTVSYEQIVSSSTSQNGESARQVGDTPKTSGDQLDVSA